MKYLVYLLLSVFTFASDTTTTEHRKWHPPKYDNQSNVLGYSPDTFSVPDDLKDRVQFWVDIYTKYTTSQGILHDSKHLDLVYETIDFTSIDKDETLTLVEKNRAKRKLEKERKKYLSDLFAKFRNLKSPEELDENERKLWEKFEKIDEKDKFEEVGRRGRLRLQMGLRDRFIQAIFDSGRYLEHMEQIFRDQNLPIELTRLPFVESSFNLNARSKSGASGIWQIMPYTARRMMKVNYVIDERNEPIKATMAAAKLLKFNYAELQDWPLAVTAYNFGVTGMKRIVTKTKSEELTDFLGKRPSRRFGFASSSFYASFLAALLVEKEAGKYFGDILWDKALEYEEVVSDKQLYFKDLVALYNDDENYAWQMNPHFTKRVVKSLFLIPSGTVLRLPLNKRADYQALTSRTSTTSMVASNDPQSYRVAPGDTLSDIARMFKVRLEQIIDANDNLNPRRLRPGQVITIP